MKKHPIDDLFKSKLSSLEKQPSSNAWSRIAREQKTKQIKPAVWIWYAAASVFVAFFAGYLVLQEKTDSNQFTEKEVAQIQKVESEQPLEVDDFSKAEKVDKDVNEEQIASVQPRKQEENASKPFKKERQIQEKQKGSDAEIQTKKEIVPLEQIAAKPFEEVKADDLKSIEPVEDKILVAEANITTENVREENRTIIVNVEEPTNEFEDKPKTSRFTKVFRQLKNARAGEPVDWKEVGFNPKNIIARVDGKKHGDENEKN